MKLKKYTLVMSVVLTLSNILNESAHSREGLRFCTDIIKKAFFYQKEIPEVKLPYPVKLLKSQSNEELEQQLQRIVNIDPQLVNHKNEGLYYTIIEKYIERIPTYDSPKELINSGMFYRDGRELKSHYVTSYTHLGALNFKSLSTYGQYKIINNRGTRYFAGTDHPRFYSAHVVDSLHYINSEFARHIFKKTDLGVIIAVPKEAAEKYFDGHNITEREIGVIKLEKIPWVRIFRVTFEFSSI